MEHTLIREIWAKATELGFKFNETDSNEMADTVLHWLKANPIIEKHDVCNSCMSTEVIDANCVCVGSHRYTTIKLEFTHCQCCGNTTSAYPAKTKFNDKQLNL